MEVVYQNGPIRREYCEAAYSLHIGKVMADSQGVHFGGGAEVLTYAWYVPL